MLHDKLLAALLAGLILAGAGFWLARAGADETAPAVAPARVFELRTYHAAPGKLDALNARFREHTNKLFVKHGMTLIGYWTPAEGEEATRKLIYILAHESRDAAKKSWADFVADPEWNKARTESEKDGKLLEKIEIKFMNPTDYSPIR